MKSKLYSFVLLLFSILFIPLQSYAADYTISFKGAAVDTSIISCYDTVVSKTLDSVVVQNVTKGIKVKVPAGSTLLLSVATALDKLKEMGQSMCIFPNPVQEESTVSFYAKEAGDAQISVYGIDGKIYVSKNRTFNAGENSFQLSLPKGVYLVKVSGSGYSYVTKAISQSSSVNAPQVSFVENGKAEIVVAKKNNVQLRSAVLATSMQYTQGDRLTYKAFAGDFSAMVANEPTADDTITFNFANSTTGTSVFYEDFHWLAFPATNHVFWDATNPVRFDKWTQAEKDYGWTTTLNTFAADASTTDKDQYLLYACKGVAKMGKTTYGGDLISPKLSNIVGTQNVIVTFKSVPYMTNTGTKDEDSLLVSVVGPGTVSTSVFIIDNWPSYPAFSAAATTDPVKMAEHELYCTRFWRKPEAVRSFTITGATSETQIKFQGGKYYLPNVGGKTVKNRLFIDDVNVYMPNSPQ